MSFPRFRRRDYSIPRTIGKFYDWPTGGSDVTGYQTLNLIEGFDEIEDTNHGINWRDKSIYDQGDDARITHHYWAKSPSEHVTIYRPGFGKAYAGQVTCPPWYQPESYDPAEDIKRAQARLWSMAIPAQPSLAGLNAIYELKDLPGMLKQRLSGNGLKDIGNYWLALKFGWEPLLRDIRDFTNKTFNFRRILQQLLRDNGKPVRRKITLPEVVLQEYTNQGGPFWEGSEPLFVTQMYADGPYAIGTLKRSYSLGISGRFRYWLPPFRDDWRWYADMYARIFGLYPSPKVVWNAIPWSWLIDWFSNAGDVISNLDAGVADRRYADYAYSFGKYIGDSKLSVTTKWYANKQASEFAYTHASSLYRKSVYRRYRADPFGFGLKDIDLSSFQLSILGALGLQRLKSPR